MHRRLLLAASLAAPALARAAEAERVRVAIFNVTTVLPYHVAETRGIFRAHGIGAVPILLQTPPLIVQAMVAEEADATTNLVTIEGANINLRRPGTALYFALNGQNAEHRMEQFLVRPESTARTLADLKGARIMSAPGPANMSAARFVLKSAGLQEGRDYQLTEQPLGVQVGALAAGSFDAAYAIEPIATIALSRGVARTLEAGVISTHLLGRRDALTWASGPAVTRRFLEARPEAAQRFAAAWAAALKMIGEDPSVRTLFASHMNVPPDLAEAVPMLDFRMARDLTATDIADFQKFIDIAVAQGVVRGPMEARSMLRPL
jgi:NitT/TauT family transport system substrate-binding protein